MNIETLTIEIDSSKIKEATAALEELALAAEKAENALESLKNYMQEKFKRE